MTFRAYSRQNCNGDIHTSRGKATLAHELFRRTGALRTVRFLRRKALRILLYHRFPLATRSALEQQCAHLRAHYNPVSLTQVAHWLHNGQPLPANAVAVTVDDGYRDFFYVAYPIFRQFEIPVTVFLTTSYLDEKCWLWVDEVDYALTRTTLNRFEIRSASGDNLEFRLDTAKARAQTASAINGMAKRLPNPKKLELIRDLMNTLRVSHPEKMPAEYEPLHWDEVRAMTRGGIEFGAHTKTHPILSRLTSQNELKIEIEGSKARLEEELGTPVLHFSYPNGMEQDFQPAAVELVKNSGFQTAVTAMAGLNLYGCDPFRLSRVPVEPTHPEQLFQRVAAGFRLNRK